MQRERKTWAQVARMILIQIQGRPGGENLIALRFNPVAAGNVFPGFSIQTATNSADESRAFAQTVVELMSHYSREYEISSLTVH
ncbi:MULTISPECIES: hypothetical protein [unclassified Methylobacterium]|uniref:hypothetical protein n=1 Tax=unclassified Methylobacterium TaxID=2615210 RepID=UPI001F2820F3|nr:MULTISPECIES: hypothetical protein [Methylobacterium]WFT82089.1 hypothetical protein QA634_09660 [Methylobacterium nodulans]